MSWEKIYDDRLNVYWWESDTGELRDDRQKRLGWVKDGDIWDDSSRKIGHYYDGKITDLSYNKIGEY